MNEENFGSSQIVNGLAVLNPEKPERAEMPWIGLSANAPASEYPAGGLWTEQKLFANPPGVGEIWDGVRADMGSLMPTDEQQLAELANCWWIAKEEALPASLVSSLLPAYQEKYSQELFGEEFQSPMRFFEKTQQLISQETLDHYDRPLNERSRELEGLYEVMMQMPGYGIEPPELSPDGLSIKARQAKIDALAKENPTPGTFGLGGAYMPGLSQPGMGEREALELRQELHLRKAAAWRQSLVTPQNVTQRAITDVMDEEKDVDAIIQNQNFRKWARTYYADEVEGLFDGFFGERGDVLSDPAVRSLAVQWKYSQPGAGEMVWDALDRVGKGAFTNTGSALSGGIGLALTAMGRSEEGAGTHRGGFGMTERVSNFASAKRSSPQKRQS